MKKIICLFIALMLPAACACADRYLEASISIPGLTDSRVESIELYEQDDRITAVSTLIPEYAVITDQSIFSSLSMFHSICSMNPATVRAGAQKADEKFRDMIEQYLSDPVQGIYSGEMFEKAGSVRTARFPLPDLLTYISDSLESSEEPFVFVCKEAVSSMIRSLQQTEPGQEMSVEMKIYDNWQYVSALLFNQEQVFISISFDLSSETEKRVLICYSENGRHYFRDILMKDDQNAITFTAYLRSGTESTYQQMMKDIPLTAVQLAVTKENFDLEVYGKGLSQPLLATGTATALDHGEARLNATVFIRNHEEQAADINISLLQMARPVRFSDKEIINLSDQKENDGFIITAVSKATEMAAEIIPTLPDEYQKVMIKLLYP